MPHAGKRPCVRPRIAHRPLGPNNPLRVARSSLRRREMRLESKTGSNNSARTLRRRVVSGRCSGAAQEASCDAAPHGRPVHNGRTASSAGSLWELLRPARVLVRSRAHVHKSRFWRGRSRPLCAEARMHCNLRLLVECQPVRGGDGATTAGEQRMGPRRSGGCAKNFSSGGLQVEQIFARRFLSAPYHVEPSRRR